MKDAHHIVFCLLTVIIVVASEESRRILAGPLNEATLVGNQVTLQCEAAGDTSWIIWAEYATGNTNGRPISDGEDVLEGHPYAERYTILHEDATSYDLHINMTVVGDGGTYRCTDVESGVAAFAELVMIIGDPICVSSVPVNGVVIDGLNYTIECSVVYEGNVAPVMTWTGPEPFAIEDTTTNTTVWSKLSFTASIVTAGLSFTCKTNFTTDGFGGPNAAANAPTYSSTYQTATLDLYCSCFGYSTPTTPLPTIRVNSSILIQHSTGADGAFNKSWADYKKGFSGPDSYWIGLETLYSLTGSGSCKAHVDLWSIIDSYYFADYDIFLVGSESTFYQLTVGGYSGTAGDGISKFNALKFSTYDQDHDESSGNCADAFLGGWWFDQCLFQALITLPMSDGRFGWDMLPGGYHINISKMWVICD